MRRLQSSGTIKGIQERLRMYHWYDFENRRRGSLQFPIEFHHVAGSHPRYVMPWHWHPEIEIIRPVQGALTIFSGSRRFRLEEGDVLYIPQNTVHGGEPEAGCVYECIVCDFLGMLQQNAGFSAYAEIFSGGKKIQNLYGRDDPEIRTLMERLFRVMRNRADGWQLQTIGCLFQFAGTVLEKSLFCEEPEDRTVENARSISKFQNVFKLIRSRYRDPLTLEDMAAEANMSPNYFCQVFKEITHYSPVEYLMHYRIEYSKHLLCVKHATVSEAAFLSGFNSPAYYIKVFKDLTGSTPNRYKKSFAVHS